MTLNSTPRKRLTMSPKFSACYEVTNILSGETRHFGSLAEMNGKVVINDTSEFFFRPAGDDGDDWRPVNLYWLREKVEILNAGR